MSGSSLSSDHPVDRADVTQLLHEFTAGEQEALEELLPLVYERLRHLARMQLSGERSDHTLRTTALVHEAYLKLVRHHDVDWQDRAHFFAVASRAMRQVLIEYARGKAAQKRGGGAHRLSLNEVTLRPEERADALVALDEALTRLKDVDERQSRVVEFRFFGGLSVEEAAVILDVSPSTVKRDWRTAKAWLYREMRQMMS